MDEIERLSDFLIHLDRSGIPVDGFVRTAGGQAAVAFDDELLSVHRCLTGTVYPSPADLTDSQTAAMMRFLADYHSAAGRYRTHVGLAIRNESVPVIYTDDPVRLKGRLKSLPETSRDMESAVNGAIDRLASFFGLRTVQATPTDLGPRRFTGPATWHSMETVCAGCSTGTCFAKAPVCGTLSLHPATWPEWPGVPCHANRKRGAAVSFGISQPTGRKHGRHGADITEPEVRSIPHLMVADTILSGVFFALYLRRLPLKPGETDERRRERSESLLSESIEDLIAIDSLVANGTRTFTLPCLGAAEYGET